MSISLFMTSAIGIFTVNDLNFKIILAVIWIVSVVMYCIFYDKYHKIYDSLI